MARGCEVMNRKVIHITSMGINILFALCDDGTIWQQIAGVEGWKLIAGVPQEEVA